MLHDQKVPYFLWAQATDAIVFLKNRVSHQELKNDTPKEIFLGNKHYISHIRIIGFPIFFHVSKEKRKSLEAIGRKCMFMGYCENTKEFRICIHVQRKF